MVRVISAEIVGVQSTEFKTSDGVTVKGYNLFFTYQSENINGVGVGRLYLSAKAFNAQGVAVGDSVSVAYVPSSVQGKAGKYELVA